jgi:hypothetical protein
MARRSQQHAGLVQAIQRGLHDFAAFTEAGTGIRLRPYQLVAGQAILDSIRMQRGDSLVVMMSRQAGKDELCANLKAYLLTRFMHREAGIVEVNPTYKPQTINAIDRLDRGLQANPLTASCWRKRSDFMRVVGKARVSFLSGEAHASVVGATASLLLIVNEAQDIQPAVYDHKFAPMAASTNATRVFMGTAWRRDTLLGRELRLALEKEQEDGRRRLFRYDAGDVRAVVPSYGDFVDGEIRRLGRDHPLIKTQYFNEEMDAGGGMFNERRRALIFGMNEARPDAASLPTAAGPYAFCIDVGGMDEKAGLGLEQLENSGRDSTTLSVIQVELPAQAAQLGPTYRVVQRMQWTGEDHVTVFGQIKALAERWQPRHFVVDATGVGEGLWSMLARAFRKRVLPVKFSAATKSEIGYRFLSIIETGRFRDCSAGGSDVEAQAAEQQYAACRAEVLTGPQKTMRWGVPDGLRDENGRLLHDDIVMADALVAKLDEMKWSVSFEPCIIQAADPLDERMSELRF